MTLQLGQDVKLIKLFKHKLLNENFDTNFVVLFAHHNFLYMLIKENLYNF